MSANTSTTEWEIRMVWELCQELRQAAAHADNETARHAILELAGVIMHTENPRVRRMAEAAIAATPGGSAIAAA